ncbi:hypothetical protein C8R44DRAFT_373871 [Mycena epipterygia]|nr:hypothetical protein C8R44DRAFT_373871 [Mycena epipterygia]
MMRVHTNSSQFSTPLLYRSDDGTKADLEQYKTPPRSALHAPQNPLSSSTCANTTRPASNTRAATTTFLDRKHDCGSRYCTKSAKHPPECRSFACIQHYGPDMNQRTSISTAYCATCQEAFFSNIPASPTRRRR